MMFERFTEKAIKVVMLAQEEARRLGHNFVGTEQILLGLIGESTGEDGPLAGWWVRRTCGRACPFRVSAACRQLPPAALHLAPVRHPHPLHAGIAAKVLKSMGVTLKDARVEVEKIIGRGSGFVAVEIPFTPRAKRVLELSLEEARALGASRTDQGPGRFG
jgi:ATP-dependent Clp protease ATP-binding subunit ClpC